MQLKRQITHLFVKVILAASLTNPSSAQSENRISCAAFVAKDSIMLRWAPSSLPVWQSGVKHGYVIKRYTIARDGEFIPDGLKNALILTPSPVKPAEYEKFEILASKDPRASVVQEVVYSRDFRQPPENFTDFIKSYEELEVRLGFALFMCDMSGEIAAAAGLMFTDTAVSISERYAYSISLADTPENTTVDQAVVVIDPNELTVLPPVDDISAIFLDRVVKFRWPVTLFKGIYTAYIIEKSLDGKNFKPISDLPLMNFTQEENPDYFIYTDSLESNNVETTYRVTGINAFGMKSPGSLNITGKGKPEFSAYATIDTAGVIDKNKVILRWRINAPENSPVTSVNILRAEKYDGPYVQLNKKPLNPSTVTFTDENPSLSNYYQVMLTGRDDLQSRSFPYFVQTEDNQPPQPPTDLSGIVDSTGIVSIYWKGNSEPDLLGYKVFRANSPNEEFIALGQPLTRENFLRDSINLNTLTQSICYRIVAIDVNYNSSDYSQILELTRPDTIPPSPAVITRIDYSEGKVIQTFDESPSTDVVLYQLYHKSESDTTFTLVSSWEKLPSKTENEVSGHGMYEFKLTTVDRAGNKSENIRKVYAHSGKNNISLAAEQSPDGRQITLRWNVPPGFDVKKTVVYRGDGDGLASAYRTITEPVSNFVDVNTEINTPYNYRVVIYSASEAVSSGKLLFIPNSKVK